LESLNTYQPTDSALTGSQALWQAMFLASSDPMIILDDEKRIRYVNPQASKLYGKPESELVGSPMTDLVQGSEREFTHQCLKEALEGRSQLFESVHIARAGSAITVEVALSSFQFDDRTHILVVVRDLRGKDEHELERQHLVHEVVFERERLRNIISSVPGVVWEVTTNPQRNEHLFNYVSDYVEFMLGYSAEEWLGEPDIAIKLIHPDDRARVKQEIAEAYEIADPEYQLESQYRWRRKSGDYIWVESQSRVVLDQHDQPVGMRGVTIDITRRKEAESNLRYQVDYNRAITQSMVEGLIVYNEKEQIAFINREAENLLGYTTRQLAGKNLHEATHPTEGRDVHTPEQCSLLIPLRRRIPVGNIEEVFVRQDGSRFTALCSSAPLFTGSALTGAVLVFRDISELKQKEAEIRSLNAELERRVQERTAQLQETNLQLEISNEQLEEMNKELEAFSYSVSHDLRAPFRHIVGFSELLQKRVGEQLDATSKKYIRTIEKSANYAGTLVDNLLDFSRIGRTELRHVAVNVNQLIDEVRTSTRHDAKNQTIRWKIEQELPQVKGDVMLLRLAFENLISNAVKYSRRNPQATIEIGLTETTSKDATFFVRDNGVGFDMKYVAKLFGVFQRLHRSEEFEGTGIGLATVARIVQRHGGKVWAESKLDEGSTFYVQLPLAKAR
jgi:PAS domain S-box-containing protein